MFVCCECCVLSGRGVCDELITRPEESYRLCCVVLCDLETSRMRRPWPALGRSATGKKNCFFSPENLAVYEISRKNTVQPDRPLMTTRRMRIACCIPKATNTHSEYVLLISIPRQLWLHVRVSILRYTYIVCLVFPFSKSSRPALAITRYQALVRRTDIKLSAM